MIGEFFMAQFMCLEPSSIVDVNLLPLNLLDLLPSLTVLTSPSNMTGVLLLLCGHPCWHGVCRIRHGCVPLLSMGPRAEVLG